MAFILILWFYFMYLLIMLYIFNSGKLKIQIHKAQRVFSVFLLFCNWDILLNVSMCWKWMKAEVNEEMFAIITLMTRMN